MKKYKPPLVIATHGILTHAKWQKTLDEILSDSAISVRNHPPNYINLLQFLSKRFRDKMVDEFYEFYSLTLNEKKSKVILEDPQKLPSIIAHSFGTYIVGYALIKHKDMKFDKIILCGSILPVAFDWSSLFANGQIKQIRNEYSSGDIWARMVGFFVNSTGGSGYKGFSTEISLIEQEKFRYFRHSDYFSKQHIIQHWISFLRKTPSGLFPLQGCEAENIREIADYLKVTRKIDETYFDILPHYNEIVVSVEHGVSWARIEPDIYTFLLFGKKKIPKGYINALPVSEKSFPNILSGLLEDSEIKPEDITQFDGKVNLYIMSIAIDSETRNNMKGLFNEAISILINAFLFKLLYYVKGRKIKIEEIIAIGWTPEGKQLCRIFNMQEVGKDKYSNPIYGIKLSNYKPDVPLVKKFPLLGELTETIRGLS